MKNNYAKKFSNEVEAKAWMKMKNNCNLVKNLRYVLIVDGNEQYVVTTLRQAIEIGCGYSF